MTDLSWHTAETSWL